MSGGRTLGQPPQFPPRLSLVRGFERNGAVLRKRRGRLGLADKRGEQAWQVRKVAGDQHIARLCPQAIADPVGRIVGLDVTRRGKISQRVARAPEGLGSLTRPQLAAVPDDRRPHAAVARLFRQPSDVPPSGIRQRTTRIDIGPNRVAVVN